MEDKEGGARIPVSPRWLKTVQKHAKSNATPHRARGVWPGRVEVVCGSPLRKQKETRTNKNHFGGHALAVEPLCMSSGSQAFCPAEAKALYCTAPLAYKCPCSDPPTAALVVLYWIGHAAQRKLLTRLRAVKYQHAVLAPKCVTL